MLKFASFGAVAQLGERRVRNAKVGSSILLRSTKLLKFQPLSVGIFFAWNASVGAVSGHGLESGGCVRSPVFALSRLSVLCFSLVASRAFARLPPGFMRLSGRWVVVGHCMDGATEVTLNDNMARLDIRTEPCKILTRSRERNSCNGSAHCSMRFANLAAQVRRTKW